MRIPQVYPTSKCKLRMLKLERIKDFLLLEEEFIRNQEVFRPHEVGVDAVCWLPDSPPVCVWRPTAT